MSSTPIHSLRIPDVFLCLETSLEGLSEAEARSRQRLYGENIISEQAQSSSWQRVLSLTRHPFIFLSLIVFVISLWQKDITLAIVILALSLTNSIFSFWREYSAQKAIEKLRNLLPAFAHVVRGGRENHIPSVEVVPGDMLILAEGDNIPADARIVEEYGLRVNNAALTGEAMASRKIGDASLASDISELERPNLIFAGTSVASGTGKAVVYATGMLTQFGRIANLTQAVQDAPSEFQIELTKLSRIVTIVAIAIGAIAWSLAQSHPEYGRHFPNPLLLAIGTIIAVTPEGLPATLTLSLAMAVQRLAGRGVLAKRLSIVETLGNVSVICTDKSGTLTQNQMTVRDIWVARQHFQVTGVGYEPKGGFVPTPGRSTLKNDMEPLLIAAATPASTRLLLSTPFGQV
jgi:Ca2+-transporting ATPase